MKKIFYRIIRELFTTVCVSIVAVWFGICSAFGGILVSQVVDLRVIVVEDSNSDAPVNAETNDDSDGKIYVDNEQKKTFVHIEFPKWSGVAAKACGDFRQQKINLHDVPRNGRSVEYKTAEIILDSDYPSTEEVMSENEKSFQKLVEQMNHYQP